MAMARTTPDLEPESEEDYELAANFLTCPKELASL
jgi:hypothetical protein